MTEKKAKQIVVNSPYTEPVKYVAYHEQDSTHEAGFVVTDGRRPSGFWREDKDGKRTFEAVPLVNEIRPKVKAWREGDYPEITGITRELLTHWHDRTERPDRPFFWCQLEAIETLIYLAETREGRMINVPNDGGDFRRVCTKLCTGGGKTVVMSMLIAWQVCNYAAYSRMHDRYTNNVLIVAPNLTVKERLGVLIPKSPNNYYDMFSIVPEGMRGMLNNAHVEITNWQAMQEDRPDPKCVVKMKERSAEAFCDEIVKGMRNILVINDEAHHAYRPRPDDAKAKTKDEKADREEATIWIQGLDKINAVCGIRMCYDFSATPFVPGREKDADRGLFGWIVSNYSLDDGIEAGIVKTPMIPIHDNVPVDTETGKSKLYHIYKYVREDLINSKAQANAALPDLVRQAYMLLGTDWLDTYNVWKDDGTKIPPVMISVVNTTNTAARIEYEFTEAGLSGVAELCEKEHMLRIDSTILSGKSDAEAESLRKEVSTTGQEGQLGGHLRNIISVGMLSEGWDARNVTQIMGLRAFTSQLLCEQIVGRGLRRTSYEAVGDGELLPQEYVSVFGIPFAYLLTEEHKAGPRVIHKPPQEVRVLDEREEYAITWPEVTGISYVMRQKLTLDVDAVPCLTLNAENVMINAALSPVLNGKTDPMMLDDIDLERFYARKRMQNIIFTAASRVYDEMRTQTENLQESGKLHIIGQVVKLTEEFMNSGKITVTPELFETDIRRRKLLLCLNMDRVIRHMWQGIRSRSYEEIVAMFPQGKRERSTGEMASWYTSRPAYRTHKSHINLCVCDSTWEDSAADALDKHSDVKAWAKNDHLGFAVKYVYVGAARKYLPDFLVKLVNGKTLILEVKGIESEQDIAKREALCEWVKAVNAVKSYGEWLCDSCTSPAEIEGVIARHA